MPRRRIVLALTAMALCLTPGLASAQAATDRGLVTLQSRHGVPETLERFEAAVRGGGWAVFTRIDHAAAAEQAGLSLRPRTVVVFGNPRAGTPAMQANPTLAFDLPLRALVWQDDQGVVWLTRNSAEYLAEAIYARHGIALPQPARQGMETLLAGFGNQATR